MKTIYFSVLLCMDSGLFAIWFIMNLVLWTFLYICLCVYMFMSFYWIYELKLLGHRIYVCVCSTLVDNAQYYPKWLGQFTFTATCMRVSIASVSLTFGILIFYFRYSNKCVISLWGLNLQFSDSWHGFPYVYPSFGYPFLTSVYSRLFNFVLNFFAFFLPI